jgi:hypothetical protein
MLITGHKSESVFERYNITSEDDLRDAMTKVDSYHEKLEEQPKEALNNDD